MKFSFPLRHLLSMSTLVLGTVAAQDAPPIPGNVPAAPAAEEAGDDSAFKTPEERRNYALGFFLANQLKRQGESEKTNLDEVEAGLNSVLNGKTSADFVSGASLGSMLQRDELKVDPKLLLAAMREAMTGGKPKLSENGLRNEMQVIQQEAMQRRQEKAKIEGEANLKEATAFLEKNAKADGITTTPSGLQFKMVSPGKGEKAKPDELVMVNFIGTTHNGKEFDRTQPGQPRPMPQTQPKGWQEAMQMMEIGSKYQFWIPPALGYGESGRPPAIRPNVVLIYEVELVGTQPAPALRGLGGNPPATGATPPVAIPGAGPKRAPISATTPPVSVDIPEQPTPQKPKTPAKAK